MQKCLTANPLRCAWAYGRTVQSLQMFADSNLQPFHALYSNCCQFAMTPAMLREHESKLSVTQQVALCVYCIWVCYSGILYQNCVSQWC